MHGSRFVEETTARTRSRRRSSCATGSPSAAMSISSRPSRSSAATAIRWCTRWPTGSRAYSTSLVCPNKTIPSSPRSSSARLATSETGCWKGRVSEISACSRPPGRAAARPIAAGGGSRRPVPGQRAGDRATRYGRSRRAARLGRFLIHGEPGSGRTTALYEQLGQEPAGLIDASELPAIGERAWLSRLDAMLASGTAVGIEAVHLLPPPVARRLAISLRHSPSRTVLTSDPAGELRGELAGLIAHCVDRLALIPLRQRRSEIPALVRSMLKRLEAPRELRFTPIAVPHPVGAGRARCHRGSPPGMRRQQEEYRETPGHQPHHAVQLDPLPWHRGGRVQKLNTVVPNRDPRM